MFRIEKENNLISECEQCTSTVPKTMNIKYNHNCVDRIFEFGVYRVQSAKSLERLTVSEKYAKQKLFFLIYKNVEIAHFSSVAIKSKNQH